MGIALFLTLIFLHIALGLALAFLVMHFAFKSEQKVLKNFGFVVGYLLIVLALLAMLLGSIFVAKAPSYMHCPYMHEKKNHEEMMEKGMPMMQEEKTETKNEKNICYKKEIKKESKGCPVKTKAQIEKDLKDGKITGAACNAEMKESKQIQKHQKK